MGSPGRGVVGLLSVVVLLGLIALAVLRLPAGQNPTVTADGGAGAGGGDRPQLTAVANNDDDPGSTGDPTETTTPGAQAATTVTTSPWFASDDPVVHLTFDDGPSEITPRVLDLLDRYDAKGTFFVMGQRVEQNPDIAVDIVERGHAIANHSYDHMDWRQPGAREDIIRTQGIIEANTGVVPSCARPPFGAENPELIATLAELGMRSWRWDVDTVDYQLQVETVEEAFEGMPFAVKIWGAEGMIVLQHDSSDQLGPSIDVLEQWLAENAERYRFEVIDNCLNYQ